MLRHCRHRKDRATCYIVLAHLLSMLLDEFLPNELKVLLVAPLDHVRLVVPVLPGSANKWIVTLSLLFLIIPVRIDIGVYPGSACKWHSFDFVRTLSERNFNKNEKCRI